MSIVAGSIVRRVGVTKAAWTHSHLLPEVPLEGGDIGVPHSKRYVSDGVSAIPEHNLCLINTETSQPAGERNSGDFLEHLANSMCVQDVAGSRALPM